ncbi:GNAT family N-acetyltransferase [Streptomyces sp. NPDC048290]|uniref:GNAT family N-acetyltransferase n=1 Tax=Streptomyces sp. NPDC048290 TaxID=3155811 RepID=UPI003419B0D1
MDMTFSDIGPADPRMDSDVAPLVRVLRPGLEAAAFREFVTEAHGQGLVITAAHGPDGGCLGVATHRVLATSRGRVLFVDDLVTAPTARGRGVGGRLMAELERRGGAAGCARVELDSGVTNHGAHRFYHAGGLSITALHFSRTLPSVAPASGGSRPD